MRLRQVFYRAFCLNGILPLAVSGTGSWIDRLLGYFEPESLVDHKKKQANFKVLYASILS
ncbi:MAG: hypothetical protein CMP86_15245 [Gammaproteobacteria bacterium]|nr:hypothetical protein [Gammaproteobacteria bacterium]